MKKIITGLLLVLMLTNLSLVFAENYDIENNKVTIIVDGNPVDTFDYDQNKSMPAFTYQGRTLLPMRRMFEIFGLDVVWHNNERSVTSKTKTGKDIWLQIDNKKVQVSGKEVDLDVPAKLINSRTYVPVRFITESIGHTIEWKNDTREVIITTNQVKVPEKYKDKYQVHYDTIEKTLLMQGHDDIDKRIIVTEKGSVYGEVINLVADQLNVRSEDFVSIKIEESSYIAYKDQFKNQKYDVVIKKNDLVYSVNFTKFTYQEMLEYIALMF